MSNPRLGGAVVLFLAGLATGALACTGSVGEGDESPAISPPLSADIAVEARPRDLSTHFGVNTSPYVQFEFRGHAALKTDWYKVADTMVARLDGEPVVAGEVVVLPPAYYEIPVPPERAAQRSPFGDGGMPGHLSSGLSDLAIIVMSVNMAKLAGGKWLEASVKIPDNTTRFSGLAGPPVDQVVTTRLGLESTPGLRTAFHIPALPGADGEASGGKHSYAKVTFELSEGISSELVSDAIYATVDGQPCVLPAPGGRSSLWSMKCPTTTAGGTLVFGVRPSDQLWLVRDGAFVPPPFERTVTLAADTGQADGALFP
jgi:hypothetical protein